MNYDSFVTNLHIPENFIKFHYRNTMEIIISFCAVLQSLVDGHFLISTNTKFPIFLWSRTFSVAH